MVFWCLAMIREVAGSQMLRWMRKATAAAGTAPL